MSDSKESVNVTIDFVHRITLMRVLGNSLSPVRLHMRAEVFPSETVEEIDFDIMIAKIKFWFETVVGRSIVFCNRNLVALDMFLPKAGTPRLVNHLMITPFEPTDEHLAVLFQSKMGALAKGNMEFGGVRLEAEDGGLVLQYVGDWRDDLPQMEDWFATKPYYFDQPWWQRDDASTLDHITTNADVDQVPSWAFRLDFIENAIRPKPTEKPAENVVIRGVFRPKIITGGSDE
jgi:hypothetical protein